MHDEYLLDSCVHCDDIHFLRCQHIQWLNISRNDDEIWNVAHFSIRNSVEKSINVLMLHHAVGGAVCVSVSASASVFEWVSVVYSSTSRTSNVIRSSLLDFKNTTLWCSTSYLVRDFAFHISTNLASSTTSHKFISYVLQCTLQCWSAWKELMQIWMIEMQISGVYFMKRCYTSLEFWW